MKQFQFQQLYKAHQQRSLVLVNTCHTGSGKHVGAGVYYINGFHVNVDEQTLILDKYTNTPSYRVGLLVTESFTTPNDDTSLNDNATGTSNLNVKVL